MLLSESSWKYLNQKQCNQLISIIQNFDNDPNIRKTIGHFITQNNLIHFKKICSFRALSSKKNFIKTLKILCKNNKIFTKTLEEYFHKKLNLVYGKTFSITIKSVVMLQNKTPIFPEPYMNIPMFIKKFFDLATNVHEKLVFLQKKEIEIEFGEQDIKNIIQTLQCINFYSIFSMEDTCKNIEQLFSGNESSKKYFILIILSKEYLCYYFNLTYNSSIFLDKTANTSVGNNTLTLGEKIEAILINETYEKTSIPIYVQNALLVTLLSNIIDILKISNPDLFLILKPNTTYTKDLEDVSLQSDYWNNWDKLLPPIVR